MGSSQTMNSGFDDSARAMQMRWRWPPENSCGYLAPSAGSSPTRRQELADAMLDLGLVLGEPEGLDRVGDDAVDAPARIEAGVGVLEDHLQAPAQRLALGRAHRRPHVDAVDGDGAGGGPQQADDHARHGRLARARFAHQRQRLAPADGERDAGHGSQVGLALALDDAVEPGLGDVEHAREVLRLDQRRSHRTCHAGASAALSATSQHATLELPACRRSGRSMRQRSKA